MRMDHTRMAAAARQAEALLKALANRHRLMILCQLVEGEKSVGELAATIELSQSALSQHLARLRADGLVGTRRASQSIYYRLEGTEAEQVIRALYDIYCAQ